MDSHLWYEEVLTNDQSIIELVMIIFINWEKQIAPAFAIPLQRYVVIIALLLQSERKKMVPTSRVK
jgi:hypothetical protein